MAGRQEELHEGRPQERVQPFKINEFTQETREALEKDGYKIYSLQGESIKSLRDAGRRFSPREGLITHSMSSEYGRITTLYKPWYRDLPDFEAFGSIQSQVAINPDKLFLPNSDNIPLAQQEEMVNKFSQELGRKIPGVKAIIGQAPDYIELTFQHYVATGDLLFGQKYNWNYAITKTPTTVWGGRNPCVAYVGSSSPDLVHVSEWMRDGYRGSVYAVPLVVPLDTQTQEFDTPEALSLYVRMSSQQRNKARMEPQTPPQQ